MEHPTAPRPIDKPGLPTFAEVDAAMSGLNVSHEVWARVSSAWDAVAWNTACFEGVERRRQAAYEAAAKALADCRAEAGRGSCELSEPPVKRDDWTEFSRELFRTDEVYADCPKAWEAAVASYLHRMEYGLATTRAVLDHAALLGSVEDCALIRDEHKAAVERLLPTAPDSVWAVFERFTWATNDRHAAAVGQPA